MSRRPALRSMTCGPERGVGNGNVRQVVADYRSDHNTEWQNGWMQAPSLNCQRDEFPPAAVWQGRDRNVWIRLSPGSGNMAEGGLFKKVCPPREQINTIGRATLHTVQSACQGRDTEIWSETVQLVETVFALDFQGIPGGIADDGITMNPCWPSTLVDDPGYALVFNDPWYARQSNQPRRSHTQFYPRPPPAAYTNGKVKRPGYQKRGISPDEIYVDQGNSSRKATDEELLRDFDLLRCQGDCIEEMEQLGVASLPIMNNPNSSPRTQEATTTQTEHPTAVITATAANSTPTTMDTIVHAATQVLSAAQSLITQSVEHVFYDEIHGNGSEEKENEDEEDVDWEYITASWVTH